MGPIATRRLLSRLRRHVLGVLAVCSMALVVAVHHTEMPVEMGAMPGMPGMVDHGAGGHDVGEATGMVACVAAFVAIGAGLLAASIGSVLLARRPDDGRPSFGLGPAPWARPVLSRAGPPDPPLLCSWRI